MRECIKCNRKLPIGMFDDNWRHKVNICKDCKRNYLNLYLKNNKRFKLQQRLYTLNREVEEIKARLYGE